jgi:hypothetical protein
MAFRQHPPLSRGLVQLALAAYAIFGIFGHGLHAILPCGDGCCEEPLAVHSSCSCGCDHAAAAEDDLDARETAYRDAGCRHDAANCSLCVLLAKINVGYTTLESADDIVAVVCGTAAPEAFSLPADLVMLASARGPPSA